MEQKPVMEVGQPDSNQHNIRQVLANAVHPIATLNLSGVRIEIGFDESDSDPTIYIGMPDLTNQRAYMSPCEAHLLIAALATAHCNTQGKDEI